MTSRPTVLASAVLSLALLGDSLLYAALPVNGATFGVSIAWIGVLLSANRITRLFIYPVLPRLAEAGGLRRFTIVAAAVGAISTLGFAIASGPWLLLAARVLWGCVFGALSLAALAYAVEGRDGAGARVGLSLSLREVGPIASLTGGMLLVTVIGLRAALLVLGSLSLLAIPIAFALPRWTSEPRVAHETPAPARANAPEILSGTLGFVADGLFPATIAVLLIEQRHGGTSVIAAGGILALKRIAVVLLAPISGHLADRTGALATSRVGFAIGAAGTILIANGYAIPGALIFLGGAAVASTSLPLLADHADPKKRLTALARLGLARDLGAAAGPLVALPLFEAIGSPTLYATAAALLLAGSLVPRAIPAGSGRFAEAHLHGASLSTHHAPEQSTR